MFKELMRIWSGKSLLSQMSEDFVGMLVDGRFMFTQVTDRWAAGEEVSSIRQKFYDVDHNINLQQQRIRRSIVAHLTVNPKSDLTASLILMSIVKDAERIGDYCKNLFEAIELLVPGDGPEDDLKQLFVMREQILEMMTLAIDSFRVQDEGRARRIIETNGPLAKLCDKYVDGYMETEKPFRNIVAFALIFRYYKRIAGHLTNIATTVVLPIDQIDYYDEDADPDE